MFDYEPMTEQEAMSERFQLLKDGEYPATINMAVDRISATSGNPMLELNLTVYDIAGKPHPIKDFLVFTKNMMWKAVKCCDAAGLLNEYESKKLEPHMLEGKNLRVIVKSQEGSIIPTDKLKGKAHGARYPDKNVIEDYKKSNEGTSSSGVDKSNNAFDDDIPF